MPRQPRLPVQFFADMLDELKSINAKLDTLISQQAPAEVSEPAGDEPAPVRLEEPVRPTSAGDTIGSPSTVGPPDEVAQIDPDFPDSGRAENAPEDTCQEQTKRGNVCGKPLPCRYHPAHGKPPSGPSGMSPSPDGSW